jgi:WD40 repeat protein
VSALWLQQERDRVVRAKQDLEKEQEETVKERDRAEEAKREARRREAEALVGQAHGARNSRQPGQRFEALAALRKAVAIGHELHQPPEWFDPLRNEAIAALTLPDVHVTHSWSGLPLGTSGADLSEDFELYARTTPQGACSIRRVSDDGELARLSEPGEPALARFGPGRLLCVQGFESGQFHLWDLSGPKPVSRLRDQRVTLGLSFRPGDRLLALPHLDGSITVYETDTGTLRHRLEPSELRAPKIAIHPFLPLVAAVSYSSPLLQVRDLKNGAVLLSPTLPWPRSAECVWSPDGRLLAVSEGDAGRIQLYTFEAVPLTLRFTRTLQGAGTGGTRICFNPAGDRLAMRGWNGKVHLFEVHTGRLLFSTPSLLSAGSNVLLRFDPSGRRLAGARVGEQQQRIGLWSVADGREYRVLGRPRPEVGVRAGRPAIHPGGRLAAQRVPDGLVLFDLETGRELAFVQDSGENGCVCFDGVGNLLSNSFGGFWRWPLRPDPAESGRWTLGPPERLPFEPGTAQIAASRDGRVIVQAMYNGYGMHKYAGGWILSPGNPQPRRVEAGRSIGWCDVSPDGRWVAFGMLSGSGSQVAVYDAATGRSVWQSTADVHHYCRFSSDGRWLLTDKEGGRAYAVDTWKPGPRLGPGIPWDLSPDGRLVVMGQSDGVYRLVERATGRELARLEAPDQVAGAAVFTENGTRLVVGADVGLRVWDLRRIRAELLELGLDWAAPSYPAADNENQATPLEIKVDLGKLAAEPNII